jgi:hypothetical protein
VSFYNVLPAVTPIDGIINFAIDELGVSHWVLNMHMISAQRANGHMILSTFDYILEDFHHGHGLDWYHSWYDVTLVLSSLILGVACIILGYTNASVGWLLLQFGAAHVFHTTRNYMNGITKYSIPDQVDNQDA